MVLMSAAATAAVIYAYAKPIISVGFAVGSSGGAIWSLGGFAKVLCPVCLEHVRQRDSEKHATGHTFECPSCHEQVPFSDLEKHAQTHGFRCSVCHLSVPLADFGTHLDHHRQELVEDRRTRDEGYQTRLEELEREYDHKMAELARAEATFNDKREQARLLWEHLESSCPVCNIPIRMAMMKSHVAQHRLSLKTGSKRRDEVASMGINLKGLKIASLVKRWAIRQ